MAVDPTTNLIYAQENGGTSFWVYDPRTDESKELAEAPINSGNNGGATYLNGKIYTVLHERLLRTGRLRHRQKRMVDDPQPARKRHGRHHRDRRHPLPRRRTRLREVRPWNRNHDAAGRSARIRPTNAKAASNGGAGIQPTTARSTGTLATAAPASSSTTSNPTDGPNLPEAPELRSGSAIDPITGTYYAYGNYGGTELLPLQHRRKREWTETLTLPFDRNRRRRHGTTSRCPG